MDSWSIWGLETFTCCTCSHEDAEDLTNRKLVGVSHPRAAYGLHHTEDLRGVSPQKLVEGRGPGRNLSTSLSGVLPRQVSDDLCPLCSNTRTQDIVADMCTLTHIQHAGDIHTHTPHAHLCPRCIFAHLGHRVYVSILATGS